ncbi:MAG: hypothetical protein PUG00_10830 [Clostridiales bacterium]|nr:hypothetical protein [Clostridiales bacterium]
MKTMRLLGRDIRNGIIAKWYLFLIPVLFAVTQTYELHNYLQSLLANNTMFVQGTIGDYILFVMKGMEVFYFDPRETFLIPVYWFAFQIGLAYMVAYYAYDDFTVNGRVIFIAAGSRKQWWISKFLYCILAGVLYFAVCAATICICAKCYGAYMSLDTTTALMMHIYPTTSVGLDQWEIMFISVLLPVLVSVAISQIQVLMGFLINPVVSFAVVCAMYILSAYYTTWYLAGSYTMWLRSSYIVADGLNPMSGALIAGGLMFAALVGGLMYFDNKDVL